MERRHSAAASTAGTVPLPECTRADIVVSCQSSTSESVPLANPAAWSDERRWKPSAVAWSACGQQVQIPLQPAVILVFQKGMPADDDPDGVHHVHPGKPPYVVRYILQGQPGHETGHLFRVVHLLSFPYRRYVVVNDLRNSLNPPSRNPPLP